MGSGCHGMDDKPNGSKAVTLLLRLATLVLGLTSAVVMATASECSIYEYEPHGGAAAKVTVSFKKYPPFVYLVFFNIAATVLEAAGIYLQVGKGGGGSGCDDDDDEAPKLARVMLVAIDVVVPALLYAATGAAFAAVVAYGPQIRACAATGAGAGFCQQVQRSKLFSLGAGISASTAAFAKDVRLPFSVWPLSSDDDHC